MNEQLLDGVNALAGRSPVVDRFGAFLATDAIFILGGIAAVLGVWLLCRHRAVSERILEPLTVLGILLAAQGLVGSVQYELHLPSDMVWVHVGLATITWVVVLWAVAAAGRLVPHVAPLPAQEPAPEPRPLESVGRAG